MINRDTIVYSLVLTGHCLVEAGYAANPSQFKVGVTAVDENGQPVPNADIGFGWGRLGFPKPDTDYIRKFADELGTAEFTGATRFANYAHGAKE